MSCPSLQSVIADIQSLYYCSWVLFTQRAKLHSGYSRIPMVCSAPLPLLITVCHLCVEINTVYLVNSAMHAVANQKINLSTEISLIYREHNDGLQNYSFKFPSPCFDVWPLAAFQPLTLRRIHFRTANVFPPSLMKELQIRDRAGSGVFSQ